jgi:hypothetical protein
MENVSGPDEGAKTDCLVCCDSPKIQRGQGTDGSSKQALEHPRGTPAARLVHEIGPPKPVSVVFI